METNLEILDLSGKKLTKINKAQPHEYDITTLILDENELQKLDHIDTYSKVQKLSIVRNQLIRMYGICRMHNLTTLNLAHNGIITIEGLKELVQLKCLCLAGNNIKTIEHLHTNVNLEHLDLSENNITHISDISYLKNLKELLLHGNRIGHLRQCERYLPYGLVTLTLASNNIADLNEISQLVHLINLNNFSITGNPCVCMVGNKVGFDYRPFVINWLMSLKVIDGYVVDAIESLRAEWLYSQGRGRHFRTGDHQELIQYLASVCPPSGETLQTEEERKLRLILSKAQHHQQQLRDQLNANGSRESSPNPSPNSKRKMSRILTPKGKSRIKSKSPDRMTSSCIMETNTSTVNNSSVPLMSQSLDSIMLSNNLINKVTSNEELNGISEEGQLYASSPLQANTKLVPVPESLMSPDYRPPNAIPTRMPTPVMRNTTTNQSRVTTLSSNTSKKVESNRNSPKMLRTPNSSPKQQRQNFNQKTSGISSSPLRTRKNLNQTTYQSDVQKHQNGNYTISMQSSPQTNNSTIHSSDEDSEMCESKLLTIRNLAQERRAGNTICKANLQQQPQHIEKQSHPSTKPPQLSETDAAIKIQKIWRGFYCRNINKDTRSILKNVKDTRTRLYIEKLATDMEKAKEALECERKIQVLQMQAINALWQKVSSMENVDSAEKNLASLDANLSSNAAVSTELLTLTKTCSELSKKVNNLQGSLDEVKSVLKTLCIKNNPSSIADTGTSTQTEIIAVHTPQGEAGKMFPYQRTPRPSSLPLPQNRIRSTSTTNDDQQQPTSTVGSEATEEVQQFVGNLVNDAMKTINESEGNTATGGQVDETTDESGVHIKSNSTLLDSKSDTFSIDDTDQQEPNNE